MNFKKLMASALLVTASALSMGAQAGLVTSNAGFTVVEDFEGFDGLVTQGPQALSNGLVMTSDVYSTLGAFAVDLVDNGTWGAGNKFAGIGDLSINPTTTTGFIGSMTIDLGNKNYGVGALFSIYNDGYVSGEIKIEAMGAYNNVLDTAHFVVDFNDYSLTNAGLFYGFTSYNADIVGLRVSGDGFVLDNVSVKAVPVPGAFLLMLSGIVGMFARRKTVA